MKSKLRIVHSVDYILKTSDVGEGVRSRDRERHAWIMNKCSPLLHQVKSFFYLSVQWLRFHRI